MSESDYPVKSPEYIKRYLEKHDCDFCRYQKFPHSMWLEGGMRRVNCYALHYGHRKAATIEPKKLNWGNIRQFGELFLQSPTSLPKAIKMLFYPPRQKPEGLEWCGGDLWFTLRGDTAQDGDFILKYKPTAKVLNSTEDRKYMIKSIRYVDEVIAYTDVDKIVQEVDFDVFVTGPDQCHAGFQRAIQWCEEHGKEHIVLGRTDGVSSSELKAKIAEKTSNKKKN